MTSSPVIMRKFKCVRCLEDDTRPCQTRFDICKKCAKEHGKERQIAGSLVTAAVNRGKIKRAYGQACVDCGAPATCLEHRDYTKPLEVEPVCRSCNSKRGVGMDSKLRVRPVKHFSGNDKKAIDREHSKLTKETK